jgi:hypothetical protein
MHSNKSADTDHQDIKEDAFATLAQLRNGYNSGKTRSYEWRIEQIKQVKRMVTENGKLLLHTHILYFTLLYLPVCENTNTHLYTDTHVPCSRTLTMRA